MKAWMTIATAIAALTLGCEPTIGGPCEYDTFDVEAQVIAFDPGEDTWDHCERTPELALEMTDVESGGTVDVYGLRAALHAPAATLDEAGLTLGSTHRMRYLVITEGTCSPEILEFVDTEADFDQVTCAADRR